MRLIRRLAGGVLVALVAAVTYYGAAILSGAEQEPEVISKPGFEVAPGRTARGKISDKFPNIQLWTHDNKPVRFYDDLVKDKTVIINFMYADCTDDCPLTTANLDRLYGHLRPRMGHGVLMLSITLSGAADTPEALRDYAEKFGRLRPGWLYLTGDYDEIDALRRTLGVYDLDPVVDADKSSHAGILTFGNDRTNRWAALPAMMDSRGLAHTVRWITRN